MPSLTRCALEATLIAFCLSQAFSQTNTAVQHPVKVVNAAQHPVPAVKQGTTVVSRNLNGTNSSLPAAGSDSSSPVSAPVTGSGTAGYIARWSTSLKLGSSLLYQNAAGDVGIGTTAPAATLDVNGTINAATGFNLGGNPFDYGSSPFFGNVFLGFAGNLPAISTSQYNVAVGYYALSNISTGEGNTAIGFDALDYDSGDSSGDGSYNTAVGMDALVVNTLGNANTAIGYLAMNGSSGGSDNTADGVGALFNNSGNYNTAIGMDALSGAGQVNNQNTATGFGALFAASTGSYNTANGYEALYANTTGNSNLAAGELSLEANTTGSWNAASGNKSLLNNTTGNYNVGVGYDAGQTIDSSAGTGSGNTIVGAGAALETGSLTNATAIGNNAVVSVSNAVVLGCVSGSNNCAGKVAVGIGTSSPTEILTLVRGGGSAVADAWQTYSSRRWKTNIQTLHGALGKVEQLRGVSYDLKASGKHEVGVIAEEVGAVIPELVTWDKNGKDAQSVDYSRLTALLIEATKEQQREIKLQQAILHTQASAIRNLKSELRATRQTLEKVKAQVNAAQPALLAAK